MRERLATRTGAPDPRQRQYTALALTAVVGGTALGWLPELRTPVLLAALTTVLALVGTHGHSLRSDIRRFAWFAPALVLVMTIGPLLSAVPLLAGLLVALVVFGTGMLPALGEQYRISGQTFAAATLLATTTGLGSDQPPLVLLGSSAAGAAFALVLRVLTGLTDPTRPARFAVSRTLLEPGPGVVEEAAAAWRTDGSRTWLGQVLAGAARFRAARETLLAQAQQSDRIEAERLNLIVAEADEIAAELAKSVQAKVCTGLPAPARRNPAHISVPAGHEQPAAVQGLIDALDRIRTAVLRRTDIPTAPAHPGAVREKLLGAARAHLSFKSSLFRHALRCTLAVALGMVVVLLLQDPSAAPCCWGSTWCCSPRRGQHDRALERTGARCSASRPWPADHPAAQRLPADPADAGLHDAQHRVVAAGLPAAAGLPDPDHRGGPGDAAGPPAGQRGDQLRRQHRGGCGDRARCGLRQLPGAAQQHPAGHPGAVRSTVWAVSERCAA